MPTERHNVLLLPATERSGGFLRDYEVKIDESGRIKPIVHEGRRYIFSQALKDRRKSDDPDEPLIFRAKEERRSFSSAVRLERRGASGADKLA